MFVDHSLKAKKKLQQFKETGDSQNIYENELDKVCFQHDIAYEAYKYLTRKTASDKILRVKHLILLRIQNSIDINVGLLQWLINFLIKKLLLCVQINLLAVALKMRICQTSN